MTTHLVALAEAGDLAAVRSALDAAAASGVHSLGGSSSPPPPPPPPPPSSSSSSPSSPAITAQAGGQLDSALAAAVRAGHLPVADLLVSHGARVTHEVELAAIASSSVDIYRLLCTRGGLDVNSDLDHMGSALCWAVIKKNLPLVEFLLRQARADPNWPLMGARHSPLALAALQSSSRDGRLGDTAASADSVNKEVEIAALLLDCGAEYDPALLYLAARNGNWPVAELLVTRCCSGGGGDNESAWAAMPPSDSPALDDGVKGPLTHYAAECGHVPFLSYLVRIGADFSAKDDQGLTALDRARAAFRVDALRFLESLEQSSS